MRFASVCSGIGAPEAAWIPMGWECAFHAEIEPFPSAVLKHHYPEVPNFGDFTEIRAGSIDVLVGGTPCQDFSVAGLRAGMDGKRGQLTVEFARLAGRIRPRWLVWENVPGVLSIDGGRAFGTFLGLLGELGYGFSYRILDAQFFGVAQRRRRVFVVGHLGDWRRAAAVLFERHSMSGHPAPGREKGKGTARGVERGTASGKPIFGTLAANVGTKLWLGNQEALSGDYHILETAPIFATDGQANAAFSEDVALAINSTHEQPYVAHSLRAEGFDASEDGTGRETPIVPIAWNESLTALQDRSPALERGGDGGPHSGVCVPILEAGARTGTSTTDPRAGIGIGEDGDPMFTLQSGKQHAIAIRTANTGANGHGVAEDVSHTLDGAQGQAVAFHNRQDPISETECSLPIQAKDNGNGLLQGMAVRRLTPRECERLQGFPDDYTAITYKGKPAADGPRYKALGNSMAVPVLKWIGERIQMVDNA